MACFVREDFNSSKNVMLNYLICKIETKEKKTCHTNNVNWKHSNTQKGDNVLSDSDKVVFYLRKDQSSMWLGPEIGQNIQHK